ncbi:hypothetical protein F4558_003121 [Micromonospora profundi]|uniref:hypothetical protein n=1 Tax=Micromonospora profundi TaxID=1420889 RepID=UPI00143A5881|nr:hypothetical protein [Micromonospora profundi]NJC13295.1 hypothetical protein [Micromonospora profundi]
MVRRGRAVPAVRAVPGLRAASMDRVASTDRAASTDRVASDRAGRWWRPVCGDRPVQLWKECA